MLMKKVIINVVAMLTVSSLLFGVVLFALLPKGKYSDNISFNVFGDGLQEYTKFDIYAKNFEKKNIKIESNTNELYQYDFDENTKDYLTHMNGQLTISFSNNKNEYQKSYKIDVKNYFPIKTLSLIEIYGDNVAVNYKYDFIWLFLLLELPTATFLTFVILRKNLCKHKRMNVV